jgi:hypothetical protein
VSIKRGYLHTGQQWSSRNALHSGRTLGFVGHVRRLTYINADLQVRHSVVTLRLRVTIV